MDLVNRHPAWGDNGGKQQILRDAQTRENAAILRAKSDAAPADDIGPRINEFLAAKLDTAFPARHQTHDRLQRCTLARAISAKQSDHLAFTHLEIQPVENVALVVPGVEALDLKHSRFPDMP